MKEKETLYGTDNQQKISSFKDDEEMHQFLKSRNKYLFKKKIKKTEKTQLYNRIMLLIKMRVMRGPLFVYCLLEGLRLSKEILIDELEMGREVVIP